MIFLKSSFGVTRRVDYESCVTVQTFLVISKKHFNTENNQDMGNEPAALLNCTEAEDTEASERCTPV